LSRQIVKRAGLSQRLLLGRIRIRANRR